MGSALPSSPPSAAGRPTPTGHLDLLLGGYSVRVTAASRDCLESLRVLCEAFVTAPAPEVSDELRLGSTVGIGGITTFAAWSDGELVASEASPQKLAQRVEWLLCNQAIAHNSRLLHFHAGAVTRDGVAVLFPALSGTGKSTLTLALLSRGFSVLGDDVIFIEPRSGMVYPYWRRFNLDFRSILLLQRLGVRLTNGRSGQQRFPPSSFGLYEPPAPAPLRYVLIPDREELTPGRLTLVSDAQAAAEIMPHSASLRHGDATALQQFQRLLSGCQCYRLGTSDLALAVAAIDRLVAARNVS